MEFGLILSKPCCERKVMDNGQTVTVLFCERLLWKEHGCRKGCMISVGQTKRSVQDVTWKKARRSTGCITARAGMKSQARSQRNHGNGSKEPEHQRKIGSGRNLDASFDGKPMGGEPPNSAKMRVWRAWGLRFLSTRLSRSRCH